MRVLFLSSEVAPFSKTGGLADVSAALPVALAALGHEVRVMTPRYRGIDDLRLVAEPTAVTLEFPFGRHVARYDSIALREGLTITFVRHQGFFDRPGLYGDAGGDYPDNARRFAFFCAAALSGCQALGFAPDVVHLNDWQTGPAAVALKSGYQGTPLGDAGCVFTLHNLAYQGLFPRTAMEDLGFPWRLFTGEGVEFWSQLSFLKAGLALADQLTTVSPTYALEIQTPEGGMGFDGLLRHRSAALTGILNGIDTDEWNPATDVLLPSHFSHADLTGRAACRAALLTRYQLDPPAEGAPIFGVIGRMVAQKGADLLQAALPPVLERGARVVVLGSGDPALEQGWRVLAGRFPRAVSVQVVFDNALAHLIEAGSDFFLMPSRFEPCGLNQMYSQVYGAVPVVHGVGGLADTVTDADTPEGTGIVFHKPTVEGVRDALRRALALFEDGPRYAAVQQRGLRRDFSWGQAARKYEGLYSLCLPAAALAVR